MPCMTKYLIGLCWLALLFASCRKESVDFKADSVNDYFPLQVGKYITYKLDSILYTNFGQNETIIHYEAQDRIDAQIADNLGRPAFRIIRYLRKNSTEEWNPDNVFMAVPTGNSIEYIENNLRFVKLVVPVKQGFSWKGNSAIDTYSPDYGLTFLDDWDYTYDSVGVPLSVNSLKIENTITVDERDEFLGQDPSIGGTQYAEKTYSIEKYGKEIGLIYREFLHWEYQGPQAGRPGYYDGYGIRMSIIDHN